MWDCTPMMEVNIITYELFSPGVKGSSNKNPSYSTSNRVRAQRQ